MRKIKIFHCSIFRLGIQLFGFAKRALHAERLVVQIFPDILSHRLTKLLGVTGVAVLQEEGGGWLPRRRGGQIKVGE